MVGIVVEVVVVVVVVVTATSVVVRMIGASSVGFGLL